MFNFLKDKLKNWASKLKPEEEKPLELSEKKTKTRKTKEPKEKPGKQKARKKEKSKTKKEIKKERELKETPSLQESVEQIVQDKEKKGFFSSLFKKDKQKQVGDSLLKETDKELTKELYEHKAGADEVKTESKDSERLKEKVSFFDKFRAKLDEEKFEELFQELEMILLQNNVAIEVVDEIKKSLKEKLIGKTLKDLDIEKSLSESIKKVLIEPPDFLREIKTSLTQKQPFVIAFVGINGSGKTTTLAKVARLLKKSNLSVVLAAADTFRAAAIQQLEEHASRLNVPIIKKEYGSDPASVGFEAISYAKKHHIDVVLLDTAGRMNTKDSLMKEMEKIMRVCKPDMKIFVGESITGNDATQQARDFNESVDLSGIILSKADVDEKGGTAFSVSFITKKPIFFLGVGQSYDDLEVFEKEKLLSRLGL